MLRREFLFSVNNPCDWIFQIMKLKSAHIRMRIVIFQIIPREINAIANTKSRAIHFAYVKTQREMFEKRVNINTENAKNKLVEKERSERSLENNIYPHRTIHGCQVGPDDLRGAIWGWRRLCSRGSSQSIGDIRSAQQLMARVSIDPSAAIDIVIVC